VSGEDVRNGDAAPQREETPDTCHKYGYFCTAHGEWVSEEAVRKKQSPKRKSQSAKTCHTDGYFCKAHKKWVAGVLIRNNFASKEKNQTPSTCHKKNQRVFVSSWFSSDTNGCHSGNGTATKDLLSTSGSSRTQSYSSGGMVGSASNDDTSSPSSTNQFTPSTGRTWGQSLDPYYGQSADQQQYSTFGASDMGYTPSTVTPSGSAVATYSSSQAIDPERGYYAPQPSSDGFPTEAKSQVAGSFQFGSANMYVQSSPAAGGGSAQQTQYNDTSGYHVGSLSPPSNLYNQYSSGSTSIDREYNPPGDYPEAQNTDQNVPQSVFTKPQDYYDEEYHSENEP
jgi:hypothetical protein